MSAKISCTPALLLSNILHESPLKKKNRVYSGAALKKINMST